MHIPLGNSLLQSQLKAYTKKARRTGNILGTGAYGSVVELKSAGEIVAGKIFRISSAMQLQAVLKTVRAEVIMMTQLHHPNIVQYKGVTFIPQLRLPILLMERMMTSLHDYILSPDNFNLPMKRKVLFLLDTARGLDYLHSHTPAIIHRDLTAKNVLLDSQLRAKISDFGNSRIVDLDPNATPQTMSTKQGTLEYMPPETMGGRAANDSSLDVFSFGHLSLFTLIQQQIQPLLPPTYPDSSGILNARSELMRREEFMDKAENLMSDSHLLKLIKQCLHNHPAQRPKTGELVTKLKLKLPGI